MGLAHLRCLSQQIHRNSNCLTLSTRCIDHAAAEMELLVFLLLAVPALPMSTMSKLMMNGEKAVIGRGQICQSTVVDYVPSE